MRSLPNRQCLPYLCAAIGLLWPTLTALAAEVEGFTEPSLDIEVAASEMGILRLLAVKEGERVRAGQVLAQLDDAILRASLEMARASMESRGQLDSAKAELQLQTEIVEKLRDLHERRHASQQELERAEAQLLVAAARLKMAQEENQLKVLEYRRALLQVEKRQLRSPVDGIVTEIYKDAGEFVSLTSPNVLRVLRLDPLHVVFSVPVRHSRRLEVGQPVNVRIGNAKNPLRAEVEFVSPAADPQSETTRVRVSIPNPEERLPCGANCRLLLSGSRRSANQVTSP